MKASKNKLAYDTKYESTPAQIAKRSQRNKARRQFEAAHGNLPSTTDIDHKKMIDAGGTNVPSNLRAISQSKNTAWRKKNPKAYG